MRFSFALTLVLASICGCSSPTPADDAGSDGGGATHDVGAADGSTHDGGSDAGNDAAPAIDAAHVADAGNDAAVIVDGGHDAAQAVDANVDGGTDAAVVPDVGMCGPLEHMCPCATGFYCAHIGASCLSPSSPCP